MKKILILNFLMLTLFNFAHPVTPLMMEQKGSPDYLFGVFFFMMSAGTFLSSPKWGNQIDKIGTKKIMTIGPLIYAIGQFMFAYFTNPVLMLTGRFISGVFASAWIVGVTSYISLISKPEDRVKNFGYQLVATNLGGVVGQMLSGRIGSYGVYYSFAVQIFFLIVIAIITWVTTDNLYPEAKASAKTGFIRGYRNLRDKGYIKLMYAMIALATIANIAKGMPSYFGSDIAGFSTTQVGNLNAYVAALAFIANLFIIKQLERYFTFFKSFLLQIMSSLIGGLLIIWAVYHVDSGIVFEVSFIVALTFITLGSALYRPYVQKEIINSNKFEQGEILGVINSFNAIGMLLSSASMSLLYPLSPQLPFIGLLVFSLIALIMLVSYQNDQARTN